MEHDARLHRLLFDADRNAIRWRGTAAVHGAEQKPVTISACAQAFLTHYGIDPAAGPQGGIDIRDMQSLDGHLTMTLIVPMPWNGRRMTIRTGDPAMIQMPGMAFSSAIAAAALGRPVGRLVAHPALDGRPDLLVTHIEHAEEDGVNSVILHFSDGAERLSEPSGSF